jgi:signal transduction histidine kinase
VEATLTLLSSAVATLGHLLFALAARRSGHPVPRAFSRVALALSAWSAALLFHSLQPRQDDASLAWLLALALVPLGFDLAAALHGAASRLRTAARAAWWVAAAVGGLLAVRPDRGVPVAMALLFPGLVAVLVLVARAARARGEKPGLFVGASAIALAAALFDALEWGGRGVAPLPRFAGLGSLLIVALLGSSVARHGLFEQKPLLGRAAALSLLALAAAATVSAMLARVDLVSDRVDPGAARVVVTWLALLGFALLRERLLSLLRSPAARAREKRRRTLQSQLERLDEVLAAATGREQLEESLRRELVGPDGAAPDSEISSIELLARGQRPPARAGALLLLLRVGVRRHGWLLLALRDPRLLEAPILRRTARRLAARIAVALDAIDARELRQRAERLAELGAMAAGIAHEIKNPLGAILGALDLMESDAALKTSPSAKWLAILRDEARRLDRVTTDALALGRAPQLELAPCDPRAVVGAALLLAEERARKAGVALRLAEPAIETGTRRLDADQLRHAVLNLVLNGISVQPAGGRVGVTIVEERGGLAIHVRDDGPGIPPEARARLFEPFFTTRRSGSGLGLAVAQRAAAAHGGTLLLADPDGGYRGAHFVLELPAARSGAGGGDGAAT